MTISLFQAAYLARRAFESKPMIESLPEDQPFVLLESSSEGASYLFTDLADTITAADAHAVDSALAALRTATQAGLYAAGWMGFEAGYALEPKLQRYLGANENLLWFGLFRQRQTLTFLETELLWRSPTPTPRQARITSLTPGWSASDYAARMARIHEYILAGDIYQANLTFPADVTFEGTPLALYAALRCAQRVPYGALIFTGTRWILSFSPELFFELKAGTLTAQPMKGTAARAMLPELDDQAARDLQADAKNRAENLMIVDLLRNDLARVSLAGSVQVPSLYDIISYPTVHQMVSTITSTLAPGKDAIDALRALFPCGSITGAPKLRAMEIIKEQESGPRDVYCGAIGHIAPDGDACFSVAIRTLAITSPGTAVLGLGSGVVADSQAPDEYAECLLKAKFLSEAVPPFDLIETMIWRPETGWWAWAAHMARLQNSGRFWSFAIDTEKLQRDADALCASWTSPMRVRLLVSRGGAHSWQWSPAPAYPGTDAFVVLSPARMRSDNLFLFHKTSHRAFYDDERKRLQAQTGCFDCVFLNERAEITEGSFTTLFVRKGDHLLTPALVSGVLPGILRQSMLERGDAREAVLTLEDLRHADALLLGNSVRGFVGVALKEF
jgi:para-aminobenzoate synthetase / 4-amino-4-deoxychorismate lyase